MTSHLREGREEPTSNSSGGVTMLKIAASAALMSSTYGGYGLPCPFRDTSAEQRYHDALAKQNRAPSMLAKADAKRQRKADSRKAQFVAAPSTVRGTTNE